MFHVWTEALTNYAYPLLYCISVKKPSFPRMFREPVWSDSHITLDTTIYALTVYLTI